MALKATSKIFFRNRGIIGATAGYYLVERNNFYKSNTLQPRMDYSNASSAELAADHDFMQWVKYPTPESNAFWQRWLQQHPDKAHVVEEARQLVLLLSQEEEEEHGAELDHIWQKITAARRNDENQLPDTGRVIPFWQNKKMLSVAAAVLVMLVSGIAFFQLGKNRRIEYVTNYGEKRTILLPDSSTVTLNANTTLSVPAKWPHTGPREVQLQGEAYFSVTHQISNQKFLVTTSEGVQVEVLGTEFNVSNRGKEHKIVLASGKIRLNIAENSQNTQLDMRPGEMVSITADAKVSRKQVKPALYTSWMNDKIYFDNYTLAEVATMLEQNYGYHIVFQDTALASQRITAYLEVKSPDDILTTISETFEVDITRRNKQIIISSL